MPVAVPGQRRDAVARPDALYRQAFGGLQGPAADLRIAASPQPAILDGAGHDLARPVLDRGMVDDAVEEQGPVLHQAEHVVPPELFCFGEDSEASVEEKQTFGRLASAAGMV